MYFCRDKCARSNAKKSSYKQIDDDGGKERKSRKKIPSTCTNLLGGHLFRVNQR